MATGLMARIGRGSFQHPWLMLALWIVAVFGGAMSAGPVFNGMASSDGPAVLESVRGEAVLTAGSNESGTIVGVVDNVDAGADAVRADVRAAANRLAKISGVKEVHTPFDEGAPPEQVAAMMAGDRRALLVQVVLTDLSDDAEQTAVAAVAPELRAMAGTLSTHGQQGARVMVGGGPVINQEANDQAQADLSKAEVLSLPITLVILVFVFGGIVAALMPALIAVVSVTGSMVGLLIFAQFTTLDQNAVTVVTLMGLGLSIDYGLLLVARYREELAAGFAPSVAVGRAWATAGRTVMFSALTVAAALTGLLVLGITNLSVLGAAGIAIALVAMLVSLTLTAALLGLAKRRIHPSKRALGQAQTGASNRRSETERGFFARLARVVQRAPLITAVLVGLALLAAGYPMLSTNVRLLDSSGLPRSLESVQVVDQLRQRFGQASSPAVTVVARTDAQTLDAWARRWVDAPGVSRVYPANQVGTNLSTLDIDARGNDSQSATARDLVARVRNSRPAGVESWVTGRAALLDDLLRLIRDRLPWALGTTLIAMMILLFAMTGSVTIPIKAIVMNVISLSATFGVMNLIFQQGHLTTQLDVLKVNGFDPFVLLAVFAFAFGLSMDYEIFLIGRIKEYVDRGVPTTMALRWGLQQSGRIITSAAFLMVAVFSCFVTGRIGNIQQIGVGLAVAVAIDATIVRCVLVPATITLLGRWIWWAPRPLRRLHARFGLGERSLPPAPSSPTPVPPMTPLVRQ